MNSPFAHETSALYQQSLELAKWCEGILDRAPKNSASYAQLDQARTTLLLKIAAAAGNGTTGERRKAAELAQTAIVECAACLDLMFNKRVVSREELQRAKENLHRLIVLLTEVPGSNPPLEFQTKAA